MNEAEKRLCKNCGKRLPSFNNYCMYCGCNNDLENGQFGQIKNEEQQAIQKKYEERSSTTLPVKLIYVFIFLDIIFMSIFLVRGHNDIFLETFPYNFDKYDKVVNFDNNRFLALKNNKISILGENSINADEFNKINQEKVLDIGETYHGSGSILVAVKNKIYTISLYGNIGEYKIENQTGNLYKDYNNSFNRISNENDDYYNVIDENYFVKDDALYMNEYSDEGSYRAPFYGRLYKSKLVLDKESLDLDNAIIIGSTSSQRSILVKGDNAIKIFTNGELMQTIHSIKYKNKQYPIGDFKYIFCSAGKLLFVHKNGIVIKYDSDVFSTAEMFEHYFAEDSYFSKDTLDYLKEKSLKEDSLEIVEERSSYSYKDFKVSFANKSIVATIIIIFTIGLIVLLALLYIFRNSGFFVSCLMFTGYLFVLLLITLLYLGSKSDIKTGEIIKVAFEIIPFEAIASLIIIQIREITKYVLYKLNIETVYHFLIVIIASFCSLFAVGYLTSDMHFMAILPGIMWVFLATNEEVNTEYNLDNKSFLKLIVILCVNLILALVLCIVLHIPEYYLYILIVSFSISCCLVLNEKSNIIEHFRRFVFSNLFIIFVFIINIVTKLISLSKIEEGTFSKMFKDIIKYSIVSSIIEILFVIFICFVLAIIISMIQSLLKFVDKIDNRLLKVFIIMIVVIVLISIVIISIPYMQDLLEYVYDLIIDSNSSSNPDFSEFLY